MRNRLWSIVLLSGAPAFLLAGCDKVGVVRAPTRVVAEELDQAVVQITRASTEEREQTPTPPPPPATATVAFALPDDLGGKLLRKELTTSRPLAEPAEQPQHAKRPARLKMPEVPLPPGYGGRSSPPAQRARKQPLPGLTTPDMLVGLALGLPLPETTSLPAGVRTKEDSADVNLPAPLPILGQPLPDRASLADATADASGALVVVGTMPARSQPVTFQRQGVPDLSENYRPLLLPVPGESTDPVTASPRTPSPK